MSWRDKYLEEADKAEETAHHLSRIGDESSAKRYLAIRDTYLALAEEWQKQLDERKNDIRSSS